MALGKVEEASKALRRYPPAEMRNVARKFAEDFMRLRRDLRNHGRIVALMERVNLIMAEPTRELSRLNNSLYEVLLADEVRPAEDRVVSHAIIKADVRGSTKMTQDLLARGLNPASHFSLNLYTPVKRILERFGAAKVFIEGDAIILAIYETESNRAHQRAVAKACVLAREILSVANAYNSRVQSSDLPPLELGVGVAFQNSAPTFWIDSDSRIMISRAINLSDRLSSCSKVARRLMASHASPFNVFLLETVMEGVAEEESEELLIRYNLNGVEVNEEGFLKLSEEVSLEPLKMRLPLPWGIEEVTLHVGDVPIGESLERLVIRQGVVRRVLPNRSIGEPGTLTYYEVCINPKVLLAVEDQLARRRK
jgi:class 3 adenylate cyclase